MPPGKGSPMVVRALPHDRVEHIVCAPIAWRRSQISNPEELEQRDHLHNGHNAWEATLRGQIGQHRYASDRNPDRSAFVLVGDAF